MFPSQLGTHLNLRHLLRVLERLVNDAKVTTMRLPGLRDTYASLIKNGMDVGVVSGRLGHIRPGR